MRAVVAIAHTVHLDARELVTAIGRVSHEQDFQHLGGADAYLKGAVIPTNVGDIGTINAVA